MKFVSSAELPSATSCSSAISGGTMSSAASLSSSTDLTVLYAIWYAFSSASSSATFFAAPVSRMRTGRAVSILRLRMPGSCTKVS